MLYFSGGPRYDICMVEKVKANENVTWKQYWNKNIVGSVRSVGPHNGKVLAKVYFKDAPEVPYYVDVTELKVV